VGIEFGTENQSSAEGGAGSRFGFGTTLGKPFAAVFGTLVGALGRALRRGGGGTR